MTVLKAASTLGLAFAAFYVGILSTASAGIVITPTVAVPVNNLDGLTSTVTVQFSGRSNTTPQEVGGYGFSYTLPVTGASATSLQWATIDFDRPLAPATLVTVTGNTVTFAAASSTFSTAPQPVVGTSDSLISTVTFTIARGASDQVYNVAAGTPTSIPFGGPSGTGFVFYNGGNASIDTTLSPFSFTIQGIPPVVAAVPEPTTLSLCGVIAIVFGSRQFLVRRKELRLNAEC